MIFAFLLVSFAASAHALEIKDLNPDEQKLYETVMSDPKSAQDFMTTREYAHQAKAVADHKAPVESFPEQPQGFSPKYLLPGDKETINEAVSQSIAAMAKSLWS